MMLGGGSLGLRTDGRVVRPRPDCMSRLSPGWLGGLPGDGELDCRWRPVVLRCDRFPLAAALGLEEGEADGASGPAVVALAVTGRDDRQGGPAGGLELECDVRVDWLDLDLNGLRVGAWILGLERRRRGVGSVAEPELDRCVVARGATRADRSGKDEDAGRERQRSFHDHSVPSAAVGIELLLEGRFGDGIGVAGGVLDAEPEEVAESSWVAAGGYCFVEDAVGAKALDTAGHSEGEEHPAQAGGFVVAGAAEVDEQVRVGRGGPASTAVVEPVAEASPDRFGEGGDSPVEVQVSVADVGEPQVRSWWLRSPWYATRAVMAERAGSGELRAARTESRSTAGGGMGDSLAWARRTAGLAKTSLRSFEDAEDRPHGGDKR